MTPDLPLPDLVAAVVIVVALAAAFVLVQYWLPRRFR
jgi:hypothetical protein